MFRASGYQQPVFGCVAHEFMEEVEMLPHTRRTPGLPAKTNTMIDQILKDWKKPEWQKDSIKKK